MAGGEGKSLGCNAQRGKNVLGILAQVLLAEVREIRRSAGLRTDGARAGRVWPLPHNCRRWRGHNGVLPCMWYA